jgi:hypothetical protein
VGIRLWDGQLVDDVIFSLLLFLFIVFSFVFRTNFQLFVKMLKDAFLVKERQNLFDDVIGKSIFFFRNFMTFQVLFLSSIALIAVGRIYGFVNYAEWQAVLSAIGTVFCVLFLFYQFKQCCYYLLGSVFADPNKYKLWKTSYNAIMGIWSSFGEKRPSQLFPTLDQYFSQNRQQRNRCHTRQYANQNIKQAAFQDTYLNIISI